MLYQLSYTPRSGAILADGGSPPRFVYCPQMREGARVGQRTTVAGRSIGATHHAACFHFVRWLTTESVDAIEPMRRPKCSQ